ncbi:MAG: chemoreceptor glutamine deamidase CheD [Thermoleophilia bacterium]
MILKVGIAQYKVGFEGDFLVAQALGSCVGVVLYDHRLRIGGLAHVLLPRPLNGAAVPSGKFAVAAIPALVAKIEKACQQKPRLKARLVGGANMFGRGMEKQGVGLRNITVSREVLKELKIPVTGEDVGGTWARSVELEVATGCLRVTSCKEGVVEL